MVKYNILIYGKHQILNESNQTIDIIDLPPFSIDVTEYYEKLVAYYQEQEKKQLEPKPLDNTFNIDKGE